MLLVSVSGLFSAAALPADSPLGRTFEKRLKLVGEIKIEPLFNTHVTGFTAQTRCVVMLHY